MKTLFAKLDLRPKRSRVKLSDASNLYDIVEKLQHGDQKAAWLFSEHPKIKAIIRKRITFYRHQFHWLPEEDFEDIECGLRPKLIEIAGRIKLPDHRSEGAVVNYFKRRIMGEADYLLKRITGMKQVSDEDGNLFLKSFNQSLEGVEDSLSLDGEVDRILNDLECSRQNGVLGNLLDAVPRSSNDMVWLKCYMLRLQGCSWSSVGKKIGYRQTDTAWLRDNTARFVTRLKHRLVTMGEDVNCRICGIYTDASDVGICVFDTVDENNYLIWSKRYENYGDLDKIECKLSDIFREYDITYVIMNDSITPTEAAVICMRYLSKREAFVEYVDGLPFFRALREAPENVRGFSINTVQRRAYQLTQIKRAHLECIRDKARQTRHGDNPTD